MISEQTCAKTHIPTQASLRVKENNCQPAEADAATGHFTPQAIEALIYLGYPIGRYLHSIDAPDDILCGLPKIYARMKVSFYQNRGEFLRLKAVLQTRLERLEINELRVMARHAQQFSPLWTTKEHAAPAIAELRKYI